MDGIPGEVYFNAAYPGFSQPDAKLGSVFLPLGSSAGPVRPDLARKLGLAETRRGRGGQCGLVRLVPGRRSRGRRHLRDGRGDVDL